MEAVETQLIRLVVKAASDLFGAQVEESSVQIQKTDKKFEGDLTLVVFPFVKAARKSPEETGRMLGEYLQANCPDITAFNT
ncbi:MAG: arginine--tRNA ligase, partial [Bacteroidales bacterium]|nr:arginine--tRNA ligase [Bacteroidales bacterium]